MPNGNNYIRTIFCDDDIKMIETVDAMIESIYNKFDKKVLGNKSRIKFQNALSEFFSESNATTEYIEDCIKDIPYEDATLLYHLMLTKYVSETAVKEINSETDITVMKEKLNEFLELLIISVYDGIGILISKYGNLPKFLLEEDPNEDPEDPEDPDDFEKN